MNDRVNELPVKEKKTLIRKRWFTYLVLRYKDKIAIRQRTEKDIWQGLYEFPLMETSTASEPEKLLKAAEQRKWLKPGAYEIKMLSPSYKQQLSHQLIYGQFLVVQLKKAPAPSADWQWVSATALRRYAFPRLMREFTETL